MSVSSQGAYGYMVVFVSMILYTLVAPTAEAVGTARFQSPFSKETGLLVIDPEIAKSPYSHRECLRVS